MRSITSKKRKCEFLLMILQLLLLVARASGQAGQIQGFFLDKQEANKAAEQVHVLNRSPTPLFKSEQGKQKTEIHFDPATRMVMMKLLVQGPNGYFIPNIRREDFVVYENEVRQQIATVDIEHAPASLGLLLEFGGQG